MALDDGIKRKAEEDYFKAANTAEEYWINLDLAIMNEPHETEKVSTLALVAIAGELRAARKSRY